MKEPRIAGLSQALTLSERRRREAQRLSGVGFWELYHDTGEIYWSEEIYAIYQLEPHSLKPNYDAFLSLICDSDRDIIHEAYQRAVRDGSEYNVRYRIKAGTSFKWIEARGITFYDAQGQPERSIGTAQDITEIKTGQEQIEFLAYHDMLTGLANRRLFTDTLNCCLTRALQEETNLAVLFIDLDDFKLINDQFGHDIGDQVLVGVANKLKSCAGSEDLFGRIGGDEFAGLLYGVREDEVPAAVARVKEVLDAEYEADMHRFPVTASIGVTVFPNDDVDTDILLRHADRAMYEAKECGKSDIRYFDIEQFKILTARRRLLNDIASAIAGDQLELYYQPRVVLADGVEAGAEALLRWFRPDGAVAPSEVVAAIKNTTQAWNLDTWVIRTVLSHCKIFKERGLHGPFSLNINPSSIENPRFPELLQSLLAEANVRGEDIEIEILEVDSIKNFDTTVKILNQCRQLGVSFSLDDFGTGYSSLTHFHRLPISKLKIDKRFILSMGSDTESMGLVKSILAIARINRRPVIAEGIENESIADSLRQLNCDFGQGFGIAKPMPVDKYIQWGLTRLAAPKN